jgi:hypothetical protein
MDRRCQSEPRYPRSVASNHAMGAQGTDRIFRQKSASALLATTCSPLQGKRRSFAPFFTVPCWSQRAEQFSIVSTSRLNYWKNCLNLNVARPVANHTLITDLSVLVHSLNIVSSSRSLCSIRRGREQITCANQQRELQECSNSRRDYEIAVTLHPYCESCTTFAFSVRYAPADERIRNNITQRRAFAVIRKFSLTCSRPLRPS